MWYLFNCIKKKKGQDFATSNSELVAPYYLSTQLYYLTTNILLYFASLPAFTCSKSTMKTPEQCVKSFQS